ncbi:MAG: phosphate/phosphite/phosphonate ABC transporter substrate-binding protein [Desulfoarculaceae bacterium]|nr:phosphate/phosphite/phosphonate ABC transporter substrate-binding protein [Desulfoarculaceae bacterium]
MPSFFPRPWRCILACCLALFFLAACNNDQEPPPPAPTAEPGQKLTIGLLPEQDLFVQKRRYTPIVRYLSRETGMEVELKILRRYGNIVENFRDEKLDGAFFGSFTGAMAIKALGVEPLARPEYADGNSTYFGMLFVRKDSGIKTAADMKGKVFAFVDKATTAGWLLPLHYFHENKIEDYETWFKETYFAGTHEDAIHDVLDHKADVGAAKNLIYDQFAHEDKNAMKELEILAVSPKVPANTLAMRHDLDPALKAKLKTILLTMHETPDGIKALEEFGAIHFVETTVEDYQPVFDYARDIGLDLTSYHYHNQ